MKMRTAIVIVFVSLAVFCAFPVMAAEDTTADPRDVALLTGLRTDTGESSVCPLTITVGPLFLHRQNNKGRVLMTDLSTGAELLNANDLDLHFGVGYDFGLEARFGAFAVGARYFGFPEWSKKDHITATNGAWVYYTPRRVIGSVHISMSYESRLHSVELSLKWYPTSRLAVVAGPRYLVLNENLDMDVVTLADPNVRGPINTRSKNELYGGQVGVEGVFFTLGAFSADGWMKAGYYRNHMSSFTELWDHVGPHYMASDDTYKGTFVGDLGIDLTYAVTPNVLLSAGYQLLWIEKAALAPYQMRAYDLMGTGIGSTVHDHVLYQGIRLGVDVTFDICGKTEPVVTPEPAPVIEPKLEPMSKN